MHGPCRYRHTRKSNESPLQSESGNKRRFPRSSFRRRRLIVVSCPWAAQVFMEMIMSDARYYVVGDQDVWMIKVKDGEYGSCASRDEAVVFAIDAAQKLGTRGECAHVCMVDDDGRFQSKWTYDRDHHLRRSAS